MGDLNLGIDIAKLKKSAGGGGGGGGLTFEKIFDGSVSLGTTTQKELLKPYTDFTALMLTTNSGTSYLGGYFMLTDLIATDTNNSNSTGNSQVAGLRFFSDDATKFCTPSGSGTVNNVKIFGIK